MNKRQNAIANGNVTYHSGKPCNRGHNAERYASTGQCVECLKVQAAATKNMARNARIARNNKMANDMIEGKLWLPRKRQALLDRIANIMQLDVLSDELAAFIDLIDTQKMTKTELDTMFEMNDKGHVLNASDYPMKDSDAGILLIQLRGSWYVADEVVACLRQQRASVERYVE